MSDAGRAWSVALLLAAAAAPALAAVDGPGVDQKIAAARATRPPEIDGKLDDAAWAAAPVFSDFVQSFPDEGHAPTERTELRVLHDDRFLYVGVHCLDGEPQAIVRQMGRRDAVPPSDQVAVAIDSAHQHRNAYA